MKKKNNLLVAGIFGMLALIIVFIFGGMFISGIVSDIDPSAVNGTELENASAVIQPLEGSLSNMMPVIVWVCAIGVLVVGLFAMFRSRAK